MFSPLRRFHRVRCPHHPNCARPACPFGHDGSAAPPSLVILVQPAPAALPSTVPQKRPTTGQPAVPSPEPPRKSQKVGSASRPHAVSSTPPSASSGPVLRISAAYSAVPLPVRQTMLTKLFEYFHELYKDVLPANPTIAAEHALRQEEEIYSKSTKLSYRNAVIQSISVLKRRPVPDSINHSSVGTEADIASRAEKKKAIEQLQITRHHLESYILSSDAMQTWGYMVDIPEGPGGTQPHHEGLVATCDRCRTPYKVTSDPSPDECYFHHGKPYNKTISGEKMRVYNCCGRSSTEADGCTRGPHVFYESKPSELHARHPFSLLKSVEESPSSLDVVALDCEMIYTTGGMRVARVSLVDGLGKQVFDEFVRMDDGIHVIDYNTRFSGITSSIHSQALLTLASIRTTLDTLINQDTILIGHALDNDLKTLRIVHHKCVDTAILFPHPVGPPYRRALRDLAREHLNIKIQQGGGTVGHSSIEDAIATLDLVRHYILKIGKEKNANDFTSTLASEASSSSSVVSSS